MMRYYPSFTAMSHKKSKKIRNRILRTNEGLISYRIVLEIGMQSDLNHLFLNGNN